MGTTETIGRFNIDLSPALTKSGNLNADQCSEIYRQVGIKICIEELKPDKETKQQYFNFLCNTSGLRGTRIAEHMKLDRGQVSQWRRNSDKAISDISWNYIRLFFLDFLGNDYKVTNPVFFLESKEAVNL